MRPYPSSTVRLAKRLRETRQAAAAQSRRTPRLLIATVAALVFAALAWPTVRAHLQAVAVLDLVANKPVPAPLRWLVSGRVTTTDITLPLASGPIRARLYTPVGKPNAPAFIVLHGVHYLGMDEPRLIAFAASMASCGLRVLTPELLAIKDYHVGPASIDSIGDSAAWLAHQNGDRPVGIMGLSFSGSLSLLAAAAPHFRPNIKFVVAIGSEDEMVRVAEYYRTGPGKSHPDAAARAANAQKVRFNLETKILPLPNDPAGKSVSALPVPAAHAEPTTNHTVDPQTFVTTLCGAIVRNHMESQAEVQSFDFRTLILVEEQFPKIPTYYLTADPKMLSSTFVPASLRQPPQ